MTNSEKHGERIMGKFAIIALSGSVAERAIKISEQEDRNYIVVKIKGLSDEIKLRSGRKSYLVGLGDVGSLFKILREEQVSSVIFAGRMQFPDLASISADSRGYRVLLRLAKSWGNRDAIIKMINKEFLAEGIDVKSIASIIPEITQRAGFYTNHRCTMEDQVDILKGKNVLRSLSSFGCSQSVVVKRERIVAIETLEGTDRLLERCAEIFRSHEGPGGVLIKGPSNLETETAEMPAIGPGTIQGVVDAGLNGIVFSADGTVVYDSEKMFDIAEKNGKFILSE